ATKPDLIFSSLLFADLPVFMKQAHAAELTKVTKLVFPAAGWQHTLMKKDFTPEGMILGHNTLYFDNPKATAMQREFVVWYADKFKDYPNWEADRAYFAIASYKNAVEKAANAKGGAWPAVDDIIGALEGSSVARAPGARTTSPTRPSCRASLPMPTSTTSSPSIRRASRPCTRPSCKNLPELTSGTG